MPSGEAFTEGQLQEIAHALTVASDDTGVHFSVFVGSPDGAPRAYAERLHAALGAPVGDAVLLLVAPGERVLEIVTGTHLRDRLSDRAAALTALSMRSSFAGGDLAGGIVNGVRMLAEAVGHAPLGIAAGALPAANVPAIRH